MADRLTQAAAGAEERGAVRTPAQGRVHSRPTLAGAGQGSGTPSSPGMSGLSSKRSREVLNSTCGGAGGLDVTGGSDSAAAGFRASQREMAQQAFFRLQGLDHMDATAGTASAPSDIFAEQAGGPVSLSSRSGSKGTTSSGAGVQPSVRPTASPALTGVTEGSQVSDVSGFAGGGGHARSSQVGSQLGSTPSLPLSASGSVVVVPATAHVSGVVSGNKLAAKRYSSMDEFEGLMQGDEGAMIEDREPQGGASSALRPGRSTSVSLLSPPQAQAPPGGESSELESLLSAVGVPTVQGIKRSLTRAYSGVGPAFGSGVGGAGGGSKGARGSFASLTSQTSVQATSVSGSSGLGSGFLGPSSTGAGSAVPLPQGAGGTRALPKRHSSQNTAARKYAGLAVSSSAQTEEEEDSTWGQDGLVARGQGLAQVAGGAPEEKKEQAGVPSLAGLGPFLMTAAPQPALSFPASPLQGGLPAAGAGAAAGGAGGGKSSQASAIVSQNSSTGLSVINEEEGGPTPPLTATAGAGVAGTSFHALSPGTRSLRADTESGAVGELDLALVGANEGGHAPSSSARSLQGSMELRSPGGIGGVTVYGGAGAGSVAGSSSASASGGLVMLLGRESSFKTMQVAASEPLLDLDGLEDDDFGGMMVADHSPKNRHSSSHGGGGQGRARSSSGAGPVAGGEGGGGGGKKPEGSPEYSPPGSTRVEAAGEGAASGRSEPDQPSMQRAGTIGITRMLSTMNKEASLASKNEAAKRKQKAQRRLSAAMAAGLFIAKMAGGAGLDLEAMSPRNKAAAEAAAAAAESDVVVVHAAVGPGGSAADAAEDEEEDDDVVDIPSLGVSIRLLPTSMATASAMGSVFSEEEYYAYKRGLLHRVLAQSEKDIRRTALGLPLSPVSTEPGSGDSEHMLLTSDGWGMFDPALEKIALAQAAGMGNAMGEEMEGGTGRVGPAGGAMSPGAPLVGGAGAGTEAAQRGDMAAGEGGEAKTRRGSVRTSADDARRARKAAGYNPQQTAFLDQARMSRSVTRAIGGGAGGGGNDMAAGGAAGGRLDFVGLAASSHPEDGTEGDDAPGGVAGGAGAGDVSDSAGRARPRDPGLPTITEDPVSGRNSYGTARGGPIPVGGSAASPDPSSASSALSGRSNGPGLGGDKLPQALDINNMDAERGGGAFSARSTASVWDTITNVFSPKSSRIAPAPLSRSRSETDLGTARTSPAKAGGESMSHSGTKGGGGLAWLCCGASGAAHAQVVEPQPAASAGGASRTTRQ